MELNDVSVAKMIEASEPPKWVVEMHDHFAETGAFRAEDIERVLGNPREVVIPNTDNIASAFTIR